MRRHCGARLLQVWALLLAYLPSLLFLGHWEPRVAVPGTPWSFGLPVGREYADEAAGDHARHCHGDAAGCSDVPFTGGPGIALMAEALAFLGTDSPFVAGNARWWQPAGARTVAPELQPPRAFLSPM